MSAEKVKQFYNTHFFNGDGQPIKPQVLITFSIGEDAVKFPGVHLSPDTTIENLFKTYHEFLSQAAAKSPIEPEEPFKAQVLDITLITYRNNEYLLDVLEGGEYIVRRKDDGQPIDISSPTARGVIKQYTKSE